MATAPRAGLPRRRRRRQRSEEEDEPKKLYRPDPESYKGALELLNRVSLTRDDIDKWLCGEMVDIEPHPVDPHVEAYNQRRREIREMAAKVATGEAEVDEHMRLMPTPRPEPPDIELPLPPPAGRPRPAHPEDQEEEERQWLEREDEEAAEAIARAVKRYRQEGVPEEDFFLCRIPRRGTVRSSQCYPEAPVVHSQPFSISQNFCVFRTKRCEFNVSSHLLCCVGGNHCLCLPHAPNIASHSSCADDESRI